MLPKRLILRCIIAVILLGSFSLLASSCALIKKGDDDYTAEYSRLFTPATSSVPQDTPTDSTMPRPTDESPIKVTVQKAILLALENNRSLRVERFNPLISRTFEDQERALFDPVIGAEVSVERKKAKRLARSGSGSESSISDDFSGEISIAEHLPTGTEVELEGSVSTIDSSLYSDRFTSSRAGVTVTQALLKGFGLGANLASLRQARLDTLASQFELRWFGETLLAEVEETYWDYAFAQRQIEIFQESLKLAEQQLNETQEMISVGKLAETEIAAAEAEIALRRQDLINACSTLEATHLRLIRLLNPPVTNPWQRKIDLLDQPVVPDVKLDGVEAHVKVALRMRPDLNQARLDVQRGDLELVKTRNGLLPKMDLFISLGKTGYAASFGNSVDDLGGDGHDVSWGVRFEYPIVRRDARALHRRASLNREQAAEAVTNLAQLVEVDVRSAYIEVNRTKEQVGATAATRKLQEEKLRIETEKFRVGRSTMFLVAQAQRDLVSSRISEVQAVTNYLKALVELHRLEGSLLERRGISAPGREPADL